MRPDVDTSRRAGVPPVLFLGAVALALLLGAVLAGGGAYMAMSGQVADARQEAQRARAEAEDATQRATQRLGAVDRELGQIRQTMQDLDKKRAEVADKLARETVRRMELEEALQKAREKPGK